MNLAAITCTNQRPGPFLDCIRYMERQTRQPDSWVVVGDVLENLFITNRSGRKELPKATFMYRNEGVPGWANFIANMRAAMRITQESEAVTFFEDDDWYRPDHLALIEEALRDNDVVGVDGMRYFHVGDRAILNHSGVCTLAGTAFRGEKARAAMLRAIETAADLNTYAVDRFFWRLVKLEGLRFKRITEPTVVGIKGQPGASNLGIGRNATGWTPDPDGEQLRRWIGDDADLYLSKVRA